jgi:hypothetical protein
MNMSCLEFPAGFRIKNRANYFTPDCGFPQVRSVIDYLAIFSDQLA